MPFYRKKFLLFAIIAVFVVWFFIWAAFAGNELKFYVFDVGQGDAIFIETSHKNQILIDGGPNLKVLSELGEVMPFYDRTIDLAVLSHPQEDHIFGLVEVLKRYKVANVLMTGVDYPNASYREFKKILEQQNTNIVIAQRGQKVFLDENTFLDVIYPFNNFLGKGFIGDVNDNSISVILTSGDKKFLLAGDAGMKEELDLVYSEEDIDIDVLKLNHHGSKYSNSQLFLEAVSPEIAVVSSGAKNRFGHPHQETLERLGGIPLFRTDQDGRIKISSDGKDFKVITER